MTRQLRPGLALGLVATTVASGWALWAPADKPAVQPLVAAVLREATPVLGQGRAGVPVASRLQDGAGPFAATSFEPAARDPFAAAPLAPPPAPSPPAPVAVPQVNAAAAVPPSPPPPAPPPMPAYLGQMHTPDGQHIVLLNENGRTTTAQAGVRLSGGWVVQALEPAAVKLAVPGTDLSAVLVVPASGSVPKGLAP